MKINMKYLMPSKGRSGIIATALDIMGEKDCIVYVHESEYEAYAKVVPKEMLKTHNVFGIGAIRKFMYDDQKSENRDYVFQIDDDISGLEYKWMDQMTMIVDSDHIRSVIDNMYMVANDIGTPLFSVAAGVGPLLYTQLTLCYFSGFVNFLGAGIIPRLMGDMNFDTRFTVMHEDHDLSLAVKFHKRYVFIDGRYSIRATEKLDKKYGGGLSTIRNTAEHEKCHNLLRRKYGSCIQENAKAKYMKKDARRLRLVLDF
jgi:hypothetical protein